MDHTIERVVDLLDPSLNRIYNMSVEEARQRVLSGKPEAVRHIDGSFALLAREGKTIRMARSLDRPMRYFLAKREEGPALIVTDRIDTIYNQLKADGIDNQFHPSYTRMVPAHYITEIQLVGCPDPDPTYTRYFTPQRDALPADLDDIGRRYIGALADEIAKWLILLGGPSPRGVSAVHSPHPDPLPQGEGTAGDSFGTLDGHPPNSARGYSKSRGTILPLPWGEGRGEGGPLSVEPIGVCFSGGIDSGAVFLLTYHVMRKLGMSPSRLKAFTLTFGEGPDLQQARAV